MISLVGASNELPKEKEDLDALYDRFLLRYHVDPVSDGAFEKLLALRGDELPSVAAELQLTTEELRVIRASARGVEVPAETTELLKALKGWLAEQSIAVSDRRWRKVVGLLQVSAFTNGRSQVSIWDGWLLQHCLWEKPEQREAIAKWYEQRVGARDASDPARLGKIVGYWEAQLDNDRRTQAQARDARGRPLCRDATGARVPTPHGKRQKKNDGGDALYQVGREQATLAQLDRLSIDSDGKLRGDGYGSSFAHWDGRAAYLADPTNMVLELGELPPVMGPQHYSEAHVADRLAQVDALIADVDGHARGIDAKLVSLSEVIDSHLWIAPDFAEPARAGLKEAWRAAGVLRERLGHVRDGFDALPRLAEGSPDGDEHERPRDADGGALPRIPDGSPDDASAEADVADWDEGAIR